MATKLAVLLAFTWMPASGLSALPSALNATVETVEKPWITVPRVADTASSHVPLKMWQFAMVATTASRPSVRHAIPEFQVTRT